MPGVSYQGDRILTRAGRGVRVALEKMSRSRRRLPAANSSCPDVLWIVFVVHRRSALLKSNFTAPMVFDFGIRRNLLCQQHFHQPLLQPVHYTEHLHLGEIIIGIEKHLY